MRNGVRQNGVRQNGVRALPAAVGQELVSLLEAGKWPQLEAAANRVTARYPRHPLGWRALGRARLQLNRLPEAEAALSRLVSLAPNEADGHSDLGYALSAQSRKTAAEASYRRALALNPQSAETLTNLGIVLCETGRLEEAAACHAQAIRIAPDAAYAHNNCANALREMGRFAEAEACYRAALALTPAYPEAHINLGNLLKDLVRWDEAAACYRAALLLAPDSVVALKALGRLLGGWGAADAEAIACLERAMALDPADADAHTELGNILIGQRRHEAALAMYRRAQALRPLITWPAMRPAADFSAVFLDTPLAGSTPVDYLASRAPYDRHLFCVMPGALEDVALLRARGDVVFNMICNADDGADILPLALDLVERIGRPAVNHPRLVMATDRASVARRLSGISGCVVPRTIRVPGALADTEAQAAAMRLPLLIRLAGTHGGDDFEKCDDWTAVAAFACRRPDAPHYLTEYADYRSADEHYRKYRLIFIDGEIFPYHLAVHDGWKVHYFRAAMADHAWMRLEEERFLADIGGVFDAARQGALRAVAAATGLDYGGIDCGLDVDGRIVVFEANAAMLVHDEKEAIFAYKNPYVARIRDAFTAMLDRRRAAG